MGGNRYFTWDGYYRGPGAGIGFLILLGFIVYAATHPGTLDSILESLRGQFGDLTAPEVTPPADPTGTPPTDPGGAPPPAGPDAAPAP
ncbi:hypothetical protein [Streptomyces indicus]|uniref:Uncharacterized protein n=1 Tax=Streptomyces indicus TaxID=417292 RepID=A0A1G8U9B8_9ACTN|nr:hypothetical protein [Streptomyces indicus]SDJ50327.1 hypothetical protein SAMN05421806_101714 [Streptomyces indicus]